MQKAVTIEIFGRVQGVGFRYYTHKKATELSIFGFVQNKPDGSVYVEATGDENNLNTFASWCYQGPQWAKVREVNICEIPVFESTTFTIR